MKEKYVAPAFQLVRNSGPLKGKALAELPENELADYVKKCQDTRYQINPDFVLRKVAGACMVVPTGSDIDASLDSSTMTLNRTAEALWEIFQEPCTEQEAVRKCMDRFDGPAGQIESDVFRFIEEATQKRVLMEG